MLLTSAVIKIELLLGMTPKVSIKFQMSILLCSKAENILTQPSQLIPFFLSRSAGIQTQSCQSDLSPHGRIHVLCVCFDFHRLQELLLAHKLTSMDCQSSNFNGPLLCNAVHLLDPKVGKSYAI